MTLRNAVLAACALMLGVGCGDAGDASRAPAEEVQSVQSELILDGAHNNGNEHFYFLPPLLENPNPRGTFDPGAHPTVTICKLSGGACSGAPILTMTENTGGLLHRVFVHGNHYDLLWSTAQTLPRKDADYRITVFSQGHVLGLADVAVRKGILPLLFVDRDEYVPVLWGLPVPIRFRIEHGAVSNNVDECAAGTDNCSVNGTCTDTQDGFVCTCNVGYQGNGVNCVDRDECAENEDNCDTNAVCSNQQGSYSCSCNPGYTGTGDVCADVDECALGTDTCDANAHCTNTHGGFQCVCEDGYNGNGTTCTQDLCAGVVCTAQSQCHTAGVCDPSTGACSQPSLPNGTQCDDGNGNTLYDHCTDGTCAGTDLCAGVTCVAQDQCHSAGVCDHQSGSCSNPVVADGTGCDDADPATVADQCTTGVCEGIDLCAGVVCSAADQCHFAGVCDYATGLCSNPTVADGTTCNDGNAVTTSDQCTAGACSGVDLCAGVTCAAQDQCHEVGTCDYLTGSCSQPSAPDTTPCDDGNADTTSDQCSTGICAGVDLCAGVTCAAQSQCHGVGECDHQTGVCSNPVLPSGISCDDANPDTTSDVCTAGACAGVDLCAGVTCAAQSQCHGVGECDHQTGVCSNPEVPTGTACNDGDDDTTSDQCSAGLCAGVDLCAGVTCTAADACHEVGTCNHQTGLCSDPAAPDGTVCDDGEIATTSDQCASGVCLGVDLCAGVTCVATDQCHGAGDCNYLTGLCSDPALPNGTSCNDGIAATTSDTCTDGGCAGVDLCAGVVCAAADQCHVAGSCDHQTGTCDSPQIADETPCDDANPTTTSDECEAGVCVGVDLCANVTCTAQSQCHAVGVCDHQTGVCSNPLKADGATCNDGIENTTSDQCTSGVCAGVDLCDGVVCTPPDQCHSVACDHQTGLCSAPVLRVGAACNDGNECTIAECRLAGCVTTGTRVDSVRDNPQNACQVEACDPDVGAWEPAGINIGIDCGPDSSCNSSGVCEVNNTGSVAPTELPPSSSEISPASEDATQPLDFGTLAESYYAGPSAHQFPLLDETNAPIDIVIDEQTAALVTGAVKDLAGAPLSGVRVRVKGKPEYGYVLTDATGRYDIAIGGGGTLTLELDLAGYLPVDRTVTTGWHEGGRGFDVVMVPEPSAAELVDGSGASTAGVLISGPESSEPSNGADALLRTPRMFLPQGTQVKPVASAAVPVEKIGFREYTDGGQAALPAALPDTSKFTYAISLSAHSSAGTSLGDVEFWSGGQPTQVPFYVDNFLGFPVGSSVPVGTYDRGVGAWVAEETGTVLRVMSPGSGGEFRLSEACQNDDPPVPWSLANAGYTGVGLDINPQTTTAYGTAFSANGTRIYVFGLTQSRIYQYQLSTAWNLSTAVYSGKSLAIPTSYGTLTGIHLSADGTRAFATSFNTSTVRQYTLSTPGDINTGTLTGTFNLGGTSGVSGVNRFWGLTFSDNGSVMLVASDVPRAIYRFNLSTPWSITTASYSGTNLSYTDLGGTITDFAYGANGSRLFAVNGGRVYGYDLATPHAIDTATYDGFFFPMLVVQGARSINFTPTGDTFFVLAGTGNILSQFSVACPELTPARYTELGLTAAERSAMAQVYSQGDEIWRMQISRLATLDASQGHIPPVCDAALFACPGDTGGAARLAEDEPKEPDTKEGSILRTQSQTLSESVKVAGTPYSLTYHSQRSRGYKADRTLRIPVAPADKAFAPSYIGTEIEVQVGAEVQGAAGNRSVTELTWNKPLGNGAQKATVRLRQSWSAGYSNPTIFGEVAPNGPRRGAFNSAFYGRTPLAADSFRLRSYFDVQFKTEIGGWRTPVADFGGWGLDVHHAYHPGLGILYTGDGREERTGAYWIEANTEALDFTFGPDGTMYTLRYGAGGIQYIYRRGPKESAFSQYVDLSAISYPAGVAYGGAARRIRVDAFGRVYVLGNHSAPGASVRSLLRVTPTEGELLTSFDGVSPAPYGIAMDLARDGQVVILAEDGRVFRLATDGQLVQETFFPATGVISFTDLRVGPDGSVYRVNAFNTQRLYPNGTLENVTQPCSSNCGTTPTQPDTLASNAVMNIRGVFPDDRGNLYVAESFAAVGIHPAQCRIFRIDPKGILRLVAGGVGCANIVGGPHAAATAVLPTALSSINGSPDGDLYFARWNNATNTVSRLFQGQAEEALAGDECAVLNEAQAPGTTGALWVPSEDRDELYCVTSSGRHLGTWDAASNVQLLEFGYSASEPRVLTQVRDRRYCPVGPLSACPAGNTLRVDRSSEEIALLAPHDHATFVALDSQGYADSITVPAGRPGPGEVDVIDVTHDSATGLLTAMDMGGGYGAHSYLYDSLGRLRQDTDPIGGEQFLTRVDMGLDEYEVQHTRNNGLLTRYRVINSESGHTKETLDPTGALTTVFTSADGENVLTTTEDGTDLEVTTVRSPQNNLEYMRTTLHYAPAVNAVAMSVEESRVLGAAGLETTTTINGESSIVIVDDGSVSGTRSRTTTSFAGREHVEQLDTAGRVVSSAWTGAGAPLPILTEWDTCAAGKVCKTRQGTRQTELEYTNGYVSRVVASETDLSGNGAVQRSAVEYSSDGFGRTLSRTTGAGLPSESSSLTEWDVFGNLSQLTPDSRPAHQLGSNGIGLAESYIAPFITDNYGIGATFRTYDVARRPMTVSFSDGTLLAYIYNSKGRLERKMFGGASVDYLYYSCGGDPRCGKLRTVLGPYDGLQTDYDYDNFLVSDRTDGSVAFSKTVTFSYDARFRPLTVGIAGVTASQTQRYDADGLINCVSAGACAAGSARIEFNLDPALPRVASATTFAPSGETQQDAYAYNAYGQVESYSVTGEGTPFSLTYTYDSLGRVETVAEVSGGLNHGTRQYAYDDAGRLWRVWADASNPSVFDEYTYDTNGNRDCLEGAAAYDAQDRLTVCNGVSYVYDENGSVVSRDGDLFEVDVLGNLLSATVGGVTVDYLVDGEGRRVGRTENGVTTRYLYSTDQQIIAVMDAAGNILSRFYYRNGGTVPEFMVQGGVTYRILVDHLGSPREVVNVATGAVVFAASYDAWGNRVVATGAADFLPFGFAGGLYDAMTGLVRFGARDYDPAQGRWMGKDPTQDVTVPNAYERAGSDPLNGAVLAQSAP